VRRVTRTPFGSFTQVSTCPTCNGTGQTKYCHDAGKSWRTALGQSC
jgi:DnaJ-class molecular chaperone